MPRKRIATYGERGDLVRVFLLIGKDKGSERIVVQWGPKHSRGQESFASTKEGKEEAMSFAQAFALKVTDTKRDHHHYTNAELWDAFVASEVHLSPKTRKLYRHAWTYWEEYAGKREFSDSLTIKQCADFRRVMDDRGLSTASVGGILRGVRTVYNWAERHELILKNRWHLYQYKVAKAKRTKMRAEYEQPEYLAIWGTLDPLKPWDWRAYVTMGMLGLYGSRQNEILPLRWDWISNTALVIPAVFVKQGIEDLVLPMLPQTRELLAVAKAWAKRDGYAGDYVIYTGDRGKLGKSPHYTIQSFWARLQTAEKQAGVPKIRFRAGHAFRRMVVGDLIAQTGDVALALQAIGDRDLNMAKHYATRRIERVRKALTERASAMDDRGATAVQRGVNPATTPPSAETVTTDTATTYDAQP